MFLLQSIEGFSADNSTVVPTLQPIFDLDLRLLPLRAALEPFGKTAC
jgi:hypothetical protein